MRIALIAAFAAILTSFEVRDDSVTISLRSREGRDLGTITLTDDPSGIALNGALKGLPPGIHAIHLHLTAQCSADFAPAGEHWNPTNKRHGLDSPQGSHAGDLPNIEVGADSSAVVKGVTRGGSLRGTDLLLDGDGAALIVHAQRDDNVSDPAGASGERIACGATNER